MGKSVSLVLGAGGARGYAHIGVIEVLEEAGFTIDAIVGSSMGALVGGLYASGTLAQYKDWVLELDFIDMLRLVDFTLGPSGMIKGDRVFDKMAYMLSTKTIEQLPIPYTAVATDLVSRREVWLQQGDLRQAIRASIAIPMLFTPVKHRGRVLVDGGLLNPLPVAPTGSYHNDLVIAVNVNATHSSIPHADSQSAEAGVPEPTTSGLKKFFADLDIGWSSKSKEREKIQELGRFDLMSRAFETAQEALTSYKIAGYPPDVRIDIAADVCYFYEFHKAAEIIELGRQATAHVLDELTSRGQL